MYLMHGTNIMNPAGESFFRNFGSWGRPFAGPLYGCSTPSGSGGAKGMSAYGKTLCRAFYGCLTPSGSGDVGI